MVYDADICKASGGQEAEAARQTRWTITEQLPNGKVQRSVESGGSQVGRGGGSGAKEPARQGVLGLFLAQQVKPNQPMGPSITR